jgi:hypothetical protein
MIFRLPMPYCLAMWPDKPTDLPRLAILEDEDAMDTLLKAGWSLKDVLSALDTADKGGTVRIGSYGFLWREDGRIQ